MTVGRVTPGKGGQQHVTKVYCASVYVVDYTDYTDGRWQDRGMIASLSPIREKGVQGHGSRRIVTNVYTREFATLAEASAFVDDVNVAYYR